MTHETLASWVRSVAIAASATALMLAIVIITAEEVPALKDWLKQTFSHHWLGKGALSTAPFVVASIALRAKRETPRLSTLIIIETIVVILAAVAITGFFLLHTLKIV